MRRGVQTLEENRLLVVAIFLAQLEDHLELPFEFTFEDESGDEVHLFITKEVTEYAAQILDEVTAGRSHRDPPRRGGKKGKWPKGWELKSLHLRWKQGEWNYDKNKLDRWLIAKYGDGKKDDPKKTSLAIRYGRF